MEVVIRTGETGGTPVIRNRLRVQSLKRGWSMRDWSKAEWVDPKYDWKPLPVPEMPDRLLIDYATRCNLRCHMFPVCGFEVDKAFDNVNGIMNLYESRWILVEFTNDQPMV